MALNVKAALGVCLSFIAGTCWLVSETSPRRIELPSPLMGAEWRAQRPVLGAALADAQMHRDEVRDVRDRFARASTTEDRRGASTAQMSLTALMPRPAPARAAERMKLPPMVARVETEIAPEARPRNARNTDLLASLNTPARESVRSATPKAPAPPRPWKGSYTIRKGDTLVKIVRRIWQSDDPALLDLLVAANPSLAKNRNHILEGAALRIPWAKDRAAALQLAKAIPPSLAKPLPKKKKSHVYTVRKNDSLAQIAQRFLKDRRRWPEIQKLNGLRRPNLLFPGTRILLPTAG